METSYRISILRADGSAYMYVCISVCGGYIYVYMGVCVLRCVGGVHDFKYTPIHGLLQMQFFPISERRELEKASIQLSLTKRLFRVSNCS